MTDSCTQLTRDGFCDWKHASSRLSDHEIPSKDHLDAVVMLTHRLNEAGRLDVELAQQAEQVAKYWHSVLKRLVSVIKFACERNLALRGENETLGSAANGNYLGMIELIAQYDDFLKQHIQKHANLGSGHANYLSSTICEELVQLMGRRVLDEIISRIKRSRYYSVILDSTPDEGHVDQLTLVFRFMEHATPVERFVTFMPNQGHKAQEMFDGLMKFLHEHGLDLKNCRGQSYDNASAMSGRYNGLQAKVAERNKLAAWIPCAGHSLNLVGKAAAECCAAAISFFDFLECLYVFFTASTHRYEILTNALRSTDRPGPVCIPKRVTTTRWSCRADATKALVQGYHEIRAALADIVDDPNEIPKVHSEASGLYDRMGTLETGIYSVFWNDILVRLNATSLKLQDPQLDLNAAVAMLKSLQNFIAAKRGAFFSYEQQGADLSGTAEYVKVRHRRRNLRFDDGLALEAELTPSQKFRGGNYIPVIDQFVASLSQRLSSYEEVCSRFGFLGQLHTLSQTEVEQAAAKLVTIYQDDLEECFGNELLQFIDFASEYNKDQDVDDALGKELSLYRLIIEKRVKCSFPNVEIALRMYLILTITNCSGERSFSKLKLIKNRLRTSMTNERLGYLSLLSIEYDILRDTDFEDIIRDFAVRKSLKVPGL